MMTLYFTPGTCALASHIALEQAGAEYQAVRIDFASSQQKSAEYMKVNPKARVPALVTDRGILTETPAILLYISQSYPKVRLAPLEDPFALAQLNAFNSYLCSTVHIAHAHRMRGHRWVDDPAAIVAMQKKVPQTMGECFELIEREMFKGPWVMGADYTVGDAYLFTLANWLEGDGVDPARFPKIADHRRRMAEHPVVSKVVAAERAA